ncbi:MAG: PilT/PilU family type 4a pilus ATPase [Planctomycetota bacterium]|nr:MAG: PilT/PilU family type 4a pilus ATPase [Planctomycetota bacterium]
MDRAPKIDRLLDAMVENNASDLHMVPGLKPKYRIHGELQDVDHEVLTTKTCNDYLLEILTKEQKAFFLQNRDMDFLYVSQKGNRFRTNFFLQQRGLAAVFRIIPTKIASFELLNLPSQLERFANFHSGLVLVTGPTGAGKSTTLAAIIDYINSRYRKHIITLEDPIEFVHPNKKSIIHQREVGTHVESFNQGIIDAGRQDPDIVLVGEMRDTETIKLTCSLAETGVLTFATLHTNNASQTLDRIIDVFPSSQQPQIRAMLSQSLVAIFSQLLLKTVDGTARVPAYEILFSSFAVANMIREGKVQEINSYIQRGRSQGMVSMDDSLRDLLEKGIISPEDAYMVAEDKVRFEKYLVNRDQSFIR